ncbi:transcriptional regulator [Paenibacillus athensensis]|uniref:HTH deoR-type domain-containing protein n=1 Tax=Paenibacillus athensensis TaxID=1967502 RepID=A0A4Y8Q829_9BACL|nr:transcriptional regulator [Paenibacillus athensensis]MCD1260292.1 transcriptional regulator [Paenibacillus athensensis]
MKKAQRLIELMLAINERRRFTIKEMADAFGVSERTMHRDLQELCDLGMPLYTEFGPHGGYRLLHKRMLPPILFAEQEAVAMFFAFQSLQYYASLPFEAETASALNKFYHYLPDDAKLTINALKERVAFWSPQRTAGSPFLQQLLEAALAQRPVRIVYASSGGDSERTVQPIGIYSSGGRWYVPAYCFSRDKALLFRADRVLALAEAGTEEAARDLRGWTIAGWLAGQLPAEGAGGAERQSGEATAAAGTASGGGAGAAADAAGAARAHGATVAALSIADAARPPSAPHATPHSGDALADAPPLAARDAAPPAVLPLRVRLSREGMRRCADMPGFAAGLAASDDGSGGVLSAEMAPGNVPYFGRIFLGMHTDAIVEQPAELVAWIRERLQALQAAYGS